MITPVYRLWNITFLYDAYHDHGAEKAMKASFKIVGKSKEEALQKARDLFSEQENKAKELMENGTYQNEEILCDNYHEMVQEYTVRVTKPKISGSDSQKFKTVPRISDDSTNIEYIVQEIEESQK